MSGDSPDQLLEAVADGWGWKLGKPLQILATNRFGNAIVKNEVGQYFRIVPNESACRLIARSPDELEKLRQDEGFVRDWEMNGQVALAEAFQGPLAAGQVYCLVVPGMLGGSYTAENIRKSTFGELLAYSGEVTQQLEAGRPPRPGEPRA